MNSTDPLLGKKTVPLLHLGLVFLHIGAVAFGAMVGNPDDRASRTGLLV